jgi:hypothetical protein
MRCGGLEHQEFGMGQTRRRPADGCRADQRIALSSDQKDVTADMLERTWRGERPLRMPDGSTRAFLLDGDTVTMRAVAAGPGGARIGFGECVGTVLPAHAD